MTVLSYDVEDRKSRVRQSILDTWRYKDKREQDGEVHNAGTSQKNVGVGDRILETARQKALGMGDPGPLI